MGADEDVLEHGHLLEQRDVLERPRDPEADDLVRPNLRQILSLEDDASLVRPVQACDQVEERCLAGAVRADQPADLASVERERHVCQRNDSPETPRDVLDR